MKAYVSDTIAFRVSGGEEGRGVVERLIPEHNSVEVSVFPDYRKVVVHEDNITEVRKYGASEATPSTVGGLREHECGLAHVDLVNDDPQNRYYICLKCGMTEDYVNDTAVEVDIHDLVILLKLAKQFASIVRLSEDEGDAVTSVELILSQAEAR